MLTRALSLLLTSTLIAACTPAAPPPTNAPTEQIVLGAPFQLKIGQTARLGDALAIAFIAVTSDTRCPINALCVRAGEAEIVVAVTLDGQEHGPSTLTLHAGNQSSVDSVVQVEAYRLTFVALEPYPGTTPTNGSPDYTATFTLMEVDVTRIPSGYTLIQLENTRGVIVPASEAAGYGQQTDDYWTPTEADVRTLEAGLVAYLKAAPGAPSDLWEKQATYLRQWAGILRDGRRYIYASFFCAEFAGWQSRIVVVMDGGDCFFQVMYDVEQQTFTNLMVNGEA
jgi:hypothetical protein